MYCYCPAVFVTLSVYNFLMKFVDKPVRTVSVVCFEEMTWCVILASNCLFDSDPNVCLIAPKMLWIHYLVGVSHFAECRENRSVTAWEMLINLIKSAIPQLWGKWKSDMESVSRTRSPPKVNQFFPLVGPIISANFNQIGWLLLQ